jgi:hypothetical protein
MTDRFLIMVRTRLAIMLLVSAVSVALGLLVARLPVFTLVPSAVLAWAAAIALAIAAWLTLRRRSVVGLLLTYGFLGFGALAALLYRPTDAEFSSINAVVAHMAQHTASDQYLLVFLAAALAVWGASLTVSILLPRSQNRLLTSISLHLSPWMLVVAAVPLITNIYGTGLSVVFHAEHYLEHTGPSAAVSLGQALGPLGVLICGYFTFHRDQPVVTRLSALMLALTYETFYLAIATRFFALWVPLMFIGGFLTGTWNGRRQRVGLIIAATTAIFALQVPLGLRNLPHHGLVPGVTYISSQPSLVLTTHDPLNNLLFGAPLTLYVANDVPSLPDSDLVTSISPLPSFWNHWGQIKGRLRVNFFIPYSALGELLNHGWVVFVFLMALLGAAFTVAERMALRQRGLASGLSSMVVLGAASLFVVESTEYNLRSAVRLVYYVFVGVIVLAATPVGSPSSLQSQEKDSSITEGQLSSA